MKIQIDQTGNVFRVELNYCDMGFTTHHHNLKEALKIVMKHWLKLYWELRFKQTELEKLQRNLRYGHNNTRFLKK